ncbi:MAG: toxin-antitoxin system HicB family antitoxin [Anaerolineales bacterium]|nr:toxin-antitoxin system HicB family antitoxin [Anaerolineales bacterium]
MEYKGYLGKVEFDDEAKVFHGEVINLRDVITFEGTSVEELQRAFEESIDDYLEFCRERNEEPDKAFSGNFIVRVDPDLHREIYIRSRSEDASMNHWIAEKLRAAISESDS